GSGPVEPVTGATYGSNEAGVGRVHLDLGSKSLYGDVDEARIAQVVVTPDPLEQHLAGEHLARPARQLEQEPELRGREREVAAALPGGEAGWIHLEVAQQNRGVVDGRRRAPEHGTHTRDQLGHLERLGHVVVGAGLQT